MKFYDELQLGAAGSKQTIRESAGIRQKLYHTAVYAFKIIITLVFCIAFIAGYTMLFGKENSTAGVVVLLCVMVYRRAHFDVNTYESLGLIALFFALMTFGSHFAAESGPVVGFIINFSCILVMMALGCYNPQMSNQSTLVLSYLLLYDADVTGSAFSMRVVAMAVGCALVCLVFYKNHRDKAYANHVPDVLEAFDLKSRRTQWQLSAALSIAGVMAILQALGFEKIMWAGIAAMSVCIPVMDQMGTRARDRILGVLGGVVCFFALYLILPSPLYACMGIIGGIGVALSARYGWQALFNSFGALAIAESGFGLGQAMSMRVMYNFIGVAAGLIVCIAVAHVFKKWTAHRQKEEFLC